MKIVSSLIQNALTTVSPASITPQLSLFPRSTYPSTFSSEKSRPTRDDSQTGEGNTQQDKVKSLIFKLSKATPEKEKNPQDQAKDSETCLLPQLAR